MFDTRSIHGNALGKFWVVLNCEMRSHGFCMNKTVYCFYKQPFGANYCFACSPADVGNCLDWGYQRRLE